MNAPGACNAPLQGWYVMIWCVPNANATGPKAALKTAETRAGAAGKLATMANLARAETGCRLTRDPGDTVRRRGKPDSTKC